MPAIGSLGIRSTLMVLGFRSEITGTPDAVVVRTPTNPTFRWGNFLAMRQAPEAGDMSRWSALFRQHVGRPPEIGHLAFTWDAPDGEEGGVEEFLAAGFERCRTLVMTASTLRVPRTINRECTVRALSGDDDFAQLVGLWMAQNAAREPTEREGPGHEAFCRRLCADYRAMCAAGWGEWFGAFIDGRLVASLGVFVRDGLGRFQVVDTHPDYRRRGLAGTVLVHAGRYARERLGATRLVIVADADDVAKDLYASVGFVTTERLTELTRVDA